MSSPKMSEEMKKENFGKDASDMIEEESETELSEGKMSPKKFTKVNFKSVNAEVEHFIETSLNLEEYPKKLGYKTVHNIVWTTFFSQQNYYSSVFDIISSYIKAQKILYLESRSYSVFYLNCLMLPAIFLSSLASVLSLAIENYAYGGVILATVNAFNSFILAVINYSKLDAASEAHKTTAHQYDKLQSMCEFTSGKILLLPGSLKINNKSKYSELNEDDMNEDTSVKKKSNNINEKLEYIENKVTEIKETNTFIIPSEVIKRLPTIYHTNIFSKIKDFLKNEIITINQIKEHLNELRPLEYQVRVLNVKNNNIIRKIENIRTIITDKTEQLINSSNENRKIEDDFLKEIMALNKLSRCYRFFC